MQLNKNIEQAIRNHIETISISDGVGEDDIRQAIRCVMRNNPDIFWFAHQYIFDNENKCLVLKFQFSEERIRLIQDSIDDVVKNDFQIAYVRTLEIYEQVAYVYKWILSYCNYSVTSAFNQTIDSVFVRRNSVCTGYSKAAQYLFKLLGIDSKLVFGQLNNDPGKGRHCWNVVRINGAYYHFDVCFGDTVLEKVLLDAGESKMLRLSDINWNCFCVSDNEIKKTRSIEYAEDLPNCEKNISLDRILALYNIPIRKREGTIGCLLSKVGSSADIYLCNLDKTVVLKKFREENNLNCLNEYGYMSKLRGSAHLLQFNAAFSDTNHNVIAIEQSTPILDLFLSRYYHPTLAEVFLIIIDVIKGWQECYERGVIYRDVHICNVYKDNDGIYKLGDFGSCCYKPGMKEKVGNVWFMAPETYMDGLFDEFSAVYSITSLLYFILNGLRPAFVDGSNEKEALCRKMHGEELPLPVLLNLFPVQVRNLIQKNLISKGCAYAKEDRISTTNDLLQIVKLLQDEIGQNDLDKNIFMQIPNDKYCKSIKCSEIPNCNFVEKSCSTSIMLGEADLALMTEFDDNYMPDCTDYVENYCRTMGVCVMNGNNANVTFCGSSSTSKLEIGASENTPFVGISHAFNLDEDNAKLPDFTDSTNYRVIVDNPSNVKNVSFVPSSSHGENLDFTTCDSNGIVSFCDSVLEPIEKNIRRIGSFFMRHKRKIQDSSFDVYSSIFAPAEIKRKMHMLVQVYLHLLEETKQVIALAQESQKNTERRDYIPLQCKIKRGDRVDITLNIYGETLIQSQTKSIIWQGHFTKCSFDYFVPKNIDVDVLFCDAFMTINGIPVGEMKFVTNIVECPQILNTEIISHRYNKVFISYAHKDEWKVKSFHEGLKLMGVKHFFDRAYLKAGDIFPEVIRKYIDTADLFVLFWSKNASISEYVEKERMQALKRAFPHLNNRQATPLSIYPMNIEPHADLPVDMKDYYHFGEM